MNHLRMEVLALEVRMNLSAQAELNFGVTHLDLDRGDSETAPEIGLGKICRNCKCR